MKIQEQSRSLLAIHVAVLLFGFTAILGALIELPTFVLVWWRVLITSFSLLVFSNKEAIRFLFTSGPGKNVIAIGGIVAMHWLCFYGAIKWSNASLALLCMSATSAFTSIIEPWILKTPFKKRDMFVSLLLIPGFIIITREIPDNFLVGLILGICAALLAAIFSVLNKKIISGQHLMSFTLLQLGGATLFLSVLLVVNEIFSIYPVDHYLPLNMQQWIYVLILALVCTTLAYVLSLYALRKISAFTSNLIINLEPVYGIVLAFLILGDREWISSTFYFGAMFVLFIVLVYPLLNQNTK